LRRFRWVMNLPPLTENTNAPGVVSRQEM
jgi:hypothetical protein